MRSYLLAALPALFFAATVQAADFTETKLAPSDAAESDNFGSSVAISGTTVIVGAPDKNFDQGAAYLFDTTTGAQLTKLIASDPAAFAYLGWSVALSGTTAIVGASKNDANGDASGSTYLFN